MRIDFLVSLVEHILAFLYNSPKRRISAGHVRCQFEYVMELKVMSMSEMKLYNTMRKWLS